MRFACAKLHEVSIKFEYDGAVANDESQFTAPRLDEAPECGRGQKVQADGDVQQNYAQQDGLENGPHAAGYGLLERISISFLRSNLYIPPLLYIYPTLSLPEHDDGQHQTNEQANAQHCTNGDVQQSLERYRLRLVAKQTVAVLVARLATAGTRDARKISHTRLDTFSIESLQRLIGNVVAKVAQTRVGAARRQRTVWYRLQAECGVDVAAKKRKETNH